jgi:ethanolaminephosphotransferase
VIQDVTEHLGIACFTVRKKDEKGMWKKAGELAPKGVNGRANGHLNGVANGHGKRGV